jgi:hypothetical protein
MLVKQFGNGSIYSYKPPEDDDHIDRNIIAVCVIKQYKHVNNQFYLLIVVLMATHVPLILYTTGCKQYRRYA